VKKEVKLATREEAKLMDQEAKQAKKADKQAKKEAKLAARKEAKLMDQEARQAKKEAELAASQEARREAEQVKHLEEWLKQMEGTRQDLEAGKINTKEAIQKLRDIAERISR